MKLLMRKPSAPPAENVLRAFLRVLETLARRKRRVTSEAAR